MVYAKSQDGGYCKFCVLSARDGPKIKLGVLVNRPLTEFKRATETLADHFFNNRFHKESLETAASFTAMMSNLDVDVDHRLSLERSKRAAENRLKLISTAETVILCGRQSFALRSHRDDTPSTKEDPHANHGKFLQFRLQAGDHVLKQHLDSAAGSALYTSKTVQNESVVT